MINNSKGVSIHSSKEVSGTLSDCVINVTGCHSEQQTDFSVSSQSRASPCTKAVLGLFFVMVNSQTVNNGGVGVRDGERTFKNRANVGGSKGVWSVPSKARSLRVRLRGFDGVHGQCPD